MCTLPRKLVRRQWFRQLRGDSGLPYLFEYRNVPARYIYGGQDDADEEVGHESDCDSDAAIEKAAYRRFVEIDPWGAAEYQSDGDFEECHKALGSRGGVAVRSSKRKRRATSGEEHSNKFSRLAPREIRDLEGGRLSVWSSKEALYSASPRQRAEAEGVSVRRSTLRPQEPTPPPEHSRGQELTTNAGDTSVLADENLEAFAESSEVIDLTDAHEQLVNTKNEPCEEISVATTVPLLETTGEGSEDISDLEDELREVQLRRRIRAARKKAEARSRNLLGADISV